MAVLLAGFLFVSVSARAEEKVGTFSVDEVRLRPTYASSEGASGQFSLDDSAFGVRWARDKHLSAYIEVGALESRNLPIYYNTPAETGYGFTNAFAEYAGVYGRVRYGLLPIGFGYDGSIKSSSRLFQRGQLFENKVVGFADTGLSLFTKHNGYYTELILHNGAIEQSPGSRLWTTTHFGWTNDREWRAQLSLQTGYVNGEQSLGATNTIAGVNNGQTAKWRNGALFVNWSPRDWNAVIEIAGGQVEQNSHSYGYSSNRVEVTRYYTHNFGTGIRYDYFDPNTSVGQDAQTAISAMVALRSDDATSTFLIIGTKNLEEGYQVNNDELRVSWLLTPYTH